MNKICTRADYVQQWGHPTSVGIFDSECQIFSVPEMDGIIGYRWQAKNAVVLGDPICPPATLLSLVTAFTSYCNAHNKKIIYVGTSDHFAQWALHHCMYSCSIEIGSEIIINPMQNPLAGTGKNASRLRNKHSLALRDGLEVKEYIEYDCALEQSMEKVATLWQQNRKGPQIYLTQLSILSDRANKRYFYAEQQGDMIGVLILNRIDAYQGWFINILMLVPNAHNSTSEFIILKALESLRAQECNHLSIGVNAGNELGQIQGFNSFFSWVARKAYYCINRVFQLDNCERYWNKFSPVKKPSFLLFSQSRLGLQDITDILYALNVKKSK